MHRFQSPRIVIVAGKSTLRATHASDDRGVQRDHPGEARPSPWTKTDGIVTNAGITRTMIAAALVIVPDVIVIPRSTVASDPIPRSRDSSTRLGMNTWWSIELPNRIANAEIGTRLFTTSVRASPKALPRMPS